MRTVIVNSLTDPAGTNIRERLLENYPFKESDTVFDGSSTYETDPDISLATSRSGIVYVDNLDAVFHADRTVFISRHYAESGIPSLTAHFTGNFGKADFGGNPNEIARFSPSLLKAYMLNLKSISQEISATYNVTLEATHHGPTALNSTVLFVELGSTEKEWRDIRGAEKIAGALMKTLTSPLDSNGKIAVCIGGTHYSEKFNNSLFNSEFMLGPIIPKYGLENLTTDIMTQILSKSERPIRLALVDRKGLGRFKENVLHLIEQFDLEKIFV